MTLCFFGTTAEQPDTIRYQNHPILGMEQVMKTIRCANCGHAAPIGKPCPRCAGKAALADKFRTPAPKGGLFGGYAAGFGCYLAGFGFLGRNPCLFKYIIIPLLICIVIFAGLIFGCVWIIDPMLGFLDSEWISMLEWLRLALYALFYVMLVLFFVLLSFFLTLILSTVINSPFYDILSEKVEELYLGRRFDERWSWEYVKRMIIIPIRESLKLALYQLGISILLCIISLLSAGLGGVLFALAGPYMASLTIFDFIMARKYYNLNEKKNFMRKNTAFVMGFGTPAYFLPILTPFAVIGATLGFLASPNK